MSPFDVVVDVFGGIRSVGRAIGIEGSTVLRWGQKPGGYIPREYYRQLLDAAHTEGKRLTLEEVCFGRPTIRRTIHTFESPAGPLARMAFSLAGLGG